MGLDMYLSKKKKINPVKSTKYWDWDTKHEYPYESEYDELCYWRKANAIHKWFVDNVQGGTDDCDEYKVSKDQLEDLLATAKKVFSSMKLVDDDTVEMGVLLTSNGVVPNPDQGKRVENTSVAEELLPTQCGFFFGDTEYDIWYYKDIEETVKQLEKALKNINFETEDVFYASSW